MLVMNDMTADARVDREASALAQAGHEVTVLALRSDGTPNETALNGYRIQRVAEYATAGWSKPLAKTKQLRSRNSAFAAAAAADRPDVVHAHDADTLVAGHRAAVLVGAKLVYDAHELYSDMISEHGLGGAWPVQAYWKSIENRLIPAAAAVLTVSDGRAAVLKERHDITPAVIRNLPPLEEPCPESPLRAELGLSSDTPVVLYQGVLISGRGLNALVRAMSKVPGAVLAVQGFGPEESAMRESAVAAGVSNRVHFMGRVAPERLHDYACGADIGIVIYEATTLNNRIAAPNKLWSYRMAGLPVAASDVPGLRAAVCGDGVGALFDPADPESIAAALRDLLGNRERLAEMSHRSLELARTRDNWDIEKRKLIELYERLATSSTS